MRTTLNRTDPHKTIRQVLPYEFRMGSDGRMTIINTKGQTLIVTHTQVANILLDPELDVHRRKMYEAALIEFEKEFAKKKAVQ